MKYRRKGVHQSDPLRSFDSGTFRKTITLRMGRTLGMLRHER
jgi:hypothetical protein